MGDRDSVFLVRISLIKDFAEQTRGGGSVISDVMQQKCLGGTFRLKMYSESANLDSTSRVSANEMTGKFPLISSNNRQEKDKYASSIRLKHVVNRMNKIILLRHRFNSVHKIEAKLTLELNHPSIKVRHKSK